MAVQSVALDGFSLLGASAGGTWVTSTMEGWNDTPDMRRSRTSKAQQDGAWPSTGNRDGKPIVLTGYAKFTTPATAKDASRALRALVGGGRASLAIADAGGLLAADVELDGRIACSFIGDRQFKWSIPLYAPDPLLYGSPTFTQTSLASVGAGTGLLYPLAYPLNYGVPAGVTPGAISVANAGTATYWPTLRIDGPVPNPTVTLVETGDSVRYAGTVAAGQWLDVDCANRRVLLNGQVSVRSKVSSTGSWLAVPPGGGSISWTADAADPSATLSVWGYQGAWI